MFDQFKQDLTIVIEDDPRTNAIFNFNMTNTNSEKLWDFENFDVIVTYDSTGTTYTETISYVSSCPPVPGEWCISSWITDVIDPEILNNGETMNFRVTVQNNLESSTNLIVIVSTPNGVVASATRTV